jgi:hypothetical protein
MSRYLLTAIVSIAMIALAYGQCPQPPCQWGQDCECWVEYDNEWGEVEVLLDPCANVWRQCDGEPIEWPALDVELWIELECVFYWEYSSVDIHLASCYDDVCVDFYGYSRCNNGVYITVRPPFGQTLDELPFVEDVMGRTGPCFGNPIPATWTYSLNGADFEPMNNCYGGGKRFLSPRCDQFYTIRLCLDIEYHEEDGYYTWADGGFLCPAEAL